MQSHKLFQQLVEIDSPSGKEQKIAKYMLEYCAKRGVDLIQDKKGNLYFTNPKSKILLTAHMDTVQGNDHVEVTLDNEKLISKKDTILGADDKANLTQILLVMDEYFKQKKNIDFELLFTVEEELGMRGIREFDTSQLHSRRVLSYDKQGEFGQIVQSAPYGFNVEINIEGKSAHSATPEEGINALKVAAEVIYKLPIGRYEGDATFNLGLINGGNSSNTIPESVQLKGDMRSKDDDLLDELSHQIEGILEKVVKNNNGRFLYKKEKVIDGFNLNKDSKLVRTVKSAINSQNGKVNFIATLGGSDLSILAGKGFETILISSGAQNCHTSQEFIMLKDIEKMKNTTINILENIS